MKKVFSLVAILAALVAASLYFSAHLAVHKMRTAIELRDEATFSNYLDLTALQASFRAQMVGERNGAAQVLADGDGPFAGFGRNLASALLGPMIDAMVTPSGMLALMSYGTPVPTPAAVLGMPASSTADGQSGAAPRYSLSYQGWNKVVLQKADAINDPGRFILGRQGLWGWKMTAVEFPAALPDDEARTERNRGR